jgi:hypothetical protein
MGTLDFGTQFNVDNKIYILNVACSKHCLYRVVVAGGESATERTRKGGQGVVCKIGCSIGACNMRCFYIILFILFITSREGGVCPTKHVKLALYMRPDITCAHCVGVYMRLCALVELVVCVCHVCVYARGCVCGE